MIAYVQGFVLIASLLCLSGCYNPSIQHELDEVHRKSEQRIQRDILPWNSKYEITEEQAERGITLQEVIRNSILTDPELRSLFAKLGISSADLDQAGYPQNPNFNVLVQFAKEGSCPPTNLFDGYIDVRGDLNIADFWQIPFKKQVACDEVAIATEATFQRIVAITAETTEAYYGYLYARNQLKTVEKIVTVLKNIYEMALAQRDRNEINDYDVLVARSALTEWEIKWLEQDQVHYNALVGVRNAIGLELLPKDVFLLDLWDRLMVPLPPSEKLYEDAQKNNPGLQILKLKIRQAQHQQSLVRSKIIDNVRFGFEYSRYTGTTYNGPFLTFDLPIFDYQQAQLERAEQQEQEFIHEYNNAIATLRQDILTIHKTINISQAKIKRYQDHLLHFTHDALVYAHQKPESIKMNFVLFVNTEVGLLQQEYNLNTELYTLAKSIAALERRLGGVLWPE